MKVLCLFEIPICGKERWVRNLINKLVISVVQIHGSITYIFMNLYEEEE